MYRHLLHDEKPDPLQFEDGTYWIDIPRDLGYTALNLGREGMSMGDFFRPYLRRHVFAIASATDPGPFAKRLASLVGGGAKRLIGRD